MKKIMIIILIMALAIPLFATMSRQEISDAKQFINSNTSCDRLNESQLELIGDYYMEQMHPGSAHDAIENMLGGQDSANLRQTHLQMALVLYCGENNITATYGGMMGMMPAIGRFGEYGDGFMGYGMMNYGNMMGYGNEWGFVSLLFWGLIFVALVLFIYWLYRNLSGLSKNESSEELLKQRYAKGEISKEQYMSMKKDMGS